MTNAKTSADPWDTSAPQPLGGRLWESLLIVLVFLAVAGDPVPHNNEPHYLCRLKHFWNPDWCRGDLFLDSPDAHVVFVWTYGWVTRWLSLTATAWVGRILAWSLLAWAWQRLSWRLVPVPLASVLAAALWVTLTETAHLAGEWVVGGVEAKCFAYVFVLLAIRDMVDQRWNRVWIFLGAASAFHALVGGWSVVVCAGIWLTEQIRERSSLPRQFLSMLPGLVGGGLIALAGVVPALSLTWDQPTKLVAEANRIYVFERLPHHLALLSLPTEDVIRRLTRHGLLLLLFLVLSRIHRKVTSSADDPLRIINSFAWGAVILATFGFAIELVFWNQPLTAAALLRFYWFRLTDVAVPMAVAFQAVSLIVAGIRERRSWTVWGLAAALAIVGWHLAHETRVRWANPVPPADAKMRDYAAWVDVCDWVAGNTPPDALFLTPRTASSFKWRTGRPEIATYKDIPQDARTIVEWFERLQKIFYVSFDGEAEPLFSVGELGTDRAVALAREYGADYIVADQRMPLALRAVYPNRENPNDVYVVYAVND